MRMSLLVLLLSLIVLRTKASFEVLPAARKIILIVKLPDTVTNNEAILRYIPVDRVGIRSDWHEKRNSIYNKIVKWELPGDQPLLIKIPLGKQASPYYFESGDSIHIQQNGEKFIFSGNVKDKLDLLQAINNIPFTLKQPTNNKYHKTDSPEDYFSVNEYLDDYRDTLFHFLEQYKGKISNSAYKYLKSKNLAQIETLRLTKFVSLYNFYVKNNKDLAELDLLYDSTIINSSTQWLRKLPDGMHMETFYYFFARMDFKRHYGFSNNPDVGSDLRIDEDIRKTNMLLDYMNSIFKSETLYNLQTMVLTEEILRKRLFKEGAAEMLEKFYKQDIPDIYKLYVKNYEENRRHLLIQLGIGQLNRSYSLNNDQVLSKKEIRGKIAVVNFINAEDSSSEQTIIRIKRITSHFENTPHLKVYNILIGERISLSLKHLLKESQTYQLPITSSIVHDFNVKNFPTSYIIGMNGFIIPQQISLQDDSSEIALSDIISLQVAKLNDGPYANTEGEAVLIREIKEGKPNKQYHSSKNNLRVTVNTDKFDHFLDVPIRPRSAPGNSMFNDQGKILAISDIEGNYSAFRKLLQVNGVIDKDYNWVFGNGHLVLVGDFFDRGEQVTECLWLIYMLEGKARKAGGYVHYILGNHEVMNLSGDIRYVHPKYNESAEALELPYEKLYDTTSVIGQWLRSKNIIESINGVLFVHGGISNNILAMSKSIEEINDIARFGLRVKRDFLKQKDTITYNLLFSNDSPCWYRNYYASKAELKVPDYVINNTLDWFKVSRIVTGHTILANTITTHFNGRVINIDTRHVYGHSEALLVDNGTFYRTNISGEKINLDLTL